MGVLDGEKLIIFFLIKNMKSFSLTSETPDTWSKIGLWLAVLQIIGPIVSLYIATREIPLLFSIMLMELLMMMAIPYFLNIYFAYKFPFWARMQVVLFAASFIINPSPPPNH
jgi:hypothetical protein